MRWICIIAFIYTFDIQRISYVSLAYNWYLSYNWYIPRICFQRVQMPGICQVYVIYVRKEPGYVSLAMTGWHNCSISFLVCHLLSITCGYLSRLQEPATGRDTADPPPPQDSDAGDHGEQVPEDDELDSGLNTTCWTPCMYA